jgi:hypothetical protein
MARLWVAQFPHAVILAVFVDDVEDDRGRVGFTLDCLDRVLRVGHALEERRISSGG